MQSFASALVQINASSHTRTHGCVRLDDPRAMAAAVLGTTVEDVGKQIAAGKDLYEKQCKECHGANGEGNKEKFYPVIAGQHYKYLLRQMTEIRDGHRRNANPDMVKVIKPYTNDQLVAISAYQSSLVMPGNMCKPKAGGKKK